MTKYKKVNINLLKICFYSLMFLGIGITFFGGYITRGQSIMYLLHNFREDTFMDFFNSIKYGRTPYEQKVIYPPLANVIYAFIGHYIPNEIKVVGAQAMRNSQMGYMLLALYISFLTIIFVLVLLKLKKGHDLERYIYIFIMMSSTPFLYQLERANLIFLALCFLMIFVLYYSSSNTLLRHISYICLAISVSIKIYPVIFGLLLIKERKIKNIIICVLYGIVIFFAPIFFLGGARNIPLFFSNIINTSKDFQQLGYGFKVNISNTINLFEKLFNVQINNTIIVIFIIIITLMGIFIMLFLKNIEEWKLLAIPTLLMVIVPGFSYTYTLIFLIIPLTLFIDKKSKNTILDYIYMILFVLIFIPMINWKESVFALFSEDYYKLNFTTVVESISIFSFTLLLFIEGIFNIIKDAEKRRIK